jgi:hypothetical protein
MDDGSEETFTANEVAGFYGVSLYPYLEVPLVGPSPFKGGPDEVSYIHLKPLPDERYYDAVERYNVDNEIQWDEDFDARRGGKWAIRPLYPDVSDYN